MGYVRDFEDPMVVIREPETRGVFGVDMMKKNAENDRSMAHVVDAMHKASA
jgi:hypothetical protein